MLEHSACWNAQLAGTQHRLAPAQEDRPWSVPGKQLVQYYEVNDRVLGLPFLGRERCRYLDKKTRFGSIQRYWFLHLYYSQETLARRQPPKVTKKMPTTTWNQEKTRKEQFQTTRWERLCTCKDSDQWMTGRLSRMIQAPQKNVRAPERLVEQQWFLAKQI